MSDLTAVGITIGPLRGLDLDLAPGITVLTGDDACGTTLLLRVLAGQVEPDAGHVARGRCLLLETPPGEEWSPEETVAEALGAPHLLGRHMGSMSSGERQRVRLANALSSDAEVLLLDEPFGHLDGSGSFALLEALRRDGRPALVVAKTSQHAVGAADRVLDLAGGRLTERGQTRGHLTERGPAD